MVWVRVRVRIGFRVSFRIRIKVSGVGVICVVGYCVFN